MDRTRLLELVVRLGGEFSRRGMIDHCNRLRLYFLAIRHGLGDRQNRVAVDWSEDLVVEWMRLFQMTPYERDYPVQTTTECARCGKGPGTVITKGVFPTGAKLECRQCGRTWLVLRHR